MFPQSDHYYNQSPVDLIDAFTLRYEMNITTHEAILDKLRGSETLGKLVLAKSKLDSSLGNKALISRYACAIKQYSSKRAEPVFLDQIKYTQARLGLIIYNVAELLDLYRLIEPAYYEHDSATAKAVQAIQFNIMQHYAIKAQPWFFQKIGLDAQKAFWDRWIENSKKWKEAQSGIIALTGEIQRLEQIA